MKKITCLILCTIGAMCLWLWMLVSICQPDPPPVSRYPLDIAEVHTMGNFDELQIYNFSEKNSPVCISTEDFQQYGELFRPDGTDKGKWYRGRYLHSDFQENWSCIVK